MTWYERVPKVELHVHLEGAIPLAALWELVRKYGGDPSVPDMDALRRRFHYRDFPHFIETWIWKNSFLREYEDFTFFSEAVARDLARQNVRYAEVTYSPSDFFRHGLTLPGITEAVRAGLDRVREVEIALVGDMVRDQGVDNARRNVEEFNEVKGLGVTGVNLGGSEAEFPPELFVEPYEKARRYGFHTSAHAGEAAGPASVWGAVKELKAERIGHGTRAVEDPVLVAYLAEHNIPVEACPISNLRTGAVRSLREYPVRRFYEAGIPLSINTDDPAMFNTSLAGEYAALETELGFTRDEVKDLILQGIRTSWLPEARKDALAASFVNDAAWSG